MSNGFALDDTDALLPAFCALPEGGPSHASPSCRRLPWWRGVAVRAGSLGLWLSVAGHVAAIGVLCTARMTAELPAPPALVEVEFVEMPGARGGGGCSTPALPAPKGQPASAPAPQAAPLPEPALRQTPQPAMSAAPVSGVAAAASQGAASGGSGPGSGGGSGGGQGTGVGPSVGGGGQGGIAVDRMPTPLRQPKPRYPMSARRMGQSGQVLLRLFVDPEGAVREVAVVRAEPAGVFEDAAVEAARKWRFSPALSRGAAVGMWMTLPVRFALEER